MVEGPRPRARLRPGLSAHQRGPDRLPVGALALPLRGREERRTPRGERSEPTRVSGPRGCDAWLLDRGSAGGYPARVMVGDDETRERLRTWREAPGSVAIFTDIDGT